MTIYDAIYSRRDVRHFRPDAVSDEVLLRILDAAHHAGSVGFMQPWNFVVIRDVEMKEKVRDVFLREKERAAANYTGERRALYDSLKLAGIVDAPVNIAVTCDRGRRGPAVLGRNTMPDTDLYSTCCALQNLWLTARAEGLGVGWVSILDPAEVKRLLAIPKEIVLVAYLCVGYPVQWGDEPELQRVGWEHRTPLEEVVFFESWQSRTALLGRHV